MLLSACYRLLLSVRLFFLANAQRTMSLSLGFTYLIVLFLSLPLHLYLLPSIHLSNFLCLPSISFRPFLSSPRAAIITLFPYLPPRQHRHELLSLKLDRSGSAGDSLMRRDGGQKLGRAGRSLLAPSHLSPHTCSVFSQPPLLTSTVPSRASGGN